MSGWEEAVRGKLQREIDEHVQRQLDTPPLERAARRRRQMSEQAAERDSQLREINDRICRNMTSREQELLSRRSWRRLKRRRMQQLLTSVDEATSAAFCCDRHRDNDLDATLSEAVDKARRQEAARMRLEMREYIRSKLREENGAGNRTERLATDAHTSNGFASALAAGRLAASPDGLLHLDAFGVERNSDGPFTAPDLPPPYFPAPDHRYPTPFSVESTPVEPLLPPDSTPSPLEKQLWTSAPLIVYDEERTSREQLNLPPLPLPDSVAPSLLFESRFECANLRQARRVGQRSYELLVSPDRYTNHHTQWYYFRVHRFESDVAYSFSIVNFHKRESLYNHGMQPLLFANGTWRRTGTHVRYLRYGRASENPLLCRKTSYFALEFQIVFPAGCSEVYLAHCYPYSFTQLRSDIGHLEPSVLCRTRAGNACYALTLTDTGVPDGAKRGVLITARVHPGEPGSSWMMRGLIAYLASEHPGAVALRRCCVFVIVPMINPDGVIVGNYRCSLAGRDLNRNYRHPRSASFPTVAAIKSELEKLQRRTGRPLLLYCDMHGHSRRRRAFMYGNPTEQTPSLGNSAALFPLLMSQTAPTLFSFADCRFSVRRCKEATGRVVMWRQYDVTNSFTLEASFAGTDLSTSLAPYHFGIAEYESLGRSLAESVQSYINFIERPAIQAEIVGRIVRQFSESVSLARKEWLSNATLLLPPAALQHVTGALASSTELDMSLLFSSLSSCPVPTPTPVRLQPHLDRETIHQLLAAIDRSTLPETSSDSDSESECEEPIAKKKRTKRRRRGKKKRRSADATPDEPPTSAETVSSNPPPTRSRRSCSSGGQTAAFTNRYEGRHNNGIPCYSEERNIERTAKRLDELERKLNAQRRRELAEYANCPLLSDDIRRRLQRILDESGADDEEELTDELKAVVPFAEERQQQVWFDKTATRRIALTRPEAESTPLDDDRTAVTLRRYFASSNRLDRRLEPLVVDKRRSEQQTKTPLGDGKADLLPAGVPSWNARHLLRRQQTSLTLAQSSALKDDRKERSKTAFATRSISSIMTQLAINSTRMPQVACTLP